MRLLVITQKVDRNDPILGFFHRWVEEFAKNAELVTVICLEKGEYHLPKNVNVLSLGKEENVKHRVFNKFTYVLRFYKYIWQERKNYDAVFVHMNQIYAILGGFLWRISGKKIGLWYVHRQISFSLWITEKLVHVIFTSAKESFQLKSEKVYYIGHGIDTTKFKKLPRDNKSKNLIHIGRITPIKHCEVLVNAMVTLQKKDKTWNAVFIGEPTFKSDYEYLENLKTVIVQNNLSSNVNFLGPLNTEKINHELSKSFASVNMTPTGGMDKVVLESLAASCPVFTSNIIFNDIFGKYSNIFLFNFNDPIDLVTKLYLWEKNDKKEEIMTALSNKIRVEYNASTLVDKIIKILNI